MGVVRGPVFGREGDVPEVGIGEEKLDADFDLLVGKFVNVGDHALERIFGLGIRESEALAAIEWSGNGDERAVSADRQRVSFFFGERRTAGLQRDADGDLHQDALAAAAVVGKPGSFARLVDPNIEGTAVFGLDGGEHQAHSLPRLYVNDAALDFEGFGAFGHAHVGGGAQRKRSVGVEVTALLAQVAHVRFGFGGGIGRGDFGGGVEGVARIGAAVGGGGRRSRRCPTRRIGRGRRRPWVPLDVKSVVEIFDFLLQLAGDLEAFEGGLFLGNNGGG